MKPGDTLAPRDYLSIEAVPAYNTSEDRQQFHPREREDCGYVTDYRRYTHLHRRETPGKIHPK